MIKKAFMVAFFSIVCTALVCGKTSEKADQQRYIEKIENFFNRIKTFSADFIEISRIGKQSMGTFVLKRRPTKLKMDYKTPPEKIIIVKDNKALYYDKELKEKTKSSIYSSPLAFLLDPKVDLRKNVEVISCNEANDTLTIAFKKKGGAEDEHGAIVLTFSLNPFILVKWEIYRGSDRIGTEIPVQVYLQNQKIDQKVFDNSFDGYD